jgi:hypothetical protein
VKRAGKVAHVAGRVTAAALGAALDADRGQIPHAAAAAMSRGMAIATARPKAERVMPRYL